MKKLFISTQNKDKLRELHELLGEDVELSNPSPDDEDVEETGTTLWENALLKADAGFKLSGIPTIADDTGLEVDALNGAPGVYAARFAGENCTYADNVNKMIRELEGVELEKRTARFRTVIAYVDGVNEPRRFDGAVDGLILEAARGDNGFGYDPVFQAVGFDITMAEMDAESKNKISHRGLALRAFAEWWLKNS